jgi:hypothetical protein
MKESKSVKLTYKGKVETSTINGPDIIEHKPVPKIITQDTIILVYYLDFSMIKESSRQKHIEHYNAIIESTWSDSPDVMQYYVVKYVENCGRVECVNPKIVREEDSPLIIAELEKLQNIQSILLNNALNEIIE